MPDVSMFYLEEGQAFRLSGATLGHSLVDRSDKKSGAYGSERLSDFGAVAVVSRNPERFDSWDEFINSEPPRLKAKNFYRIGLFEHLKFWPVFRDADDAGDPVTIVDAILKWYGSSYRLHGIDKATRNDGAGQQFNIVQFATAGAVVFIVFAMVSMGAWWFFNR